MAYTGTQVMTMAKRLLLDVEDGAYADDMLSYLNEGMRLFATSQCCQSVVNTTVTAQTISFATLVALITGALELLYVNAVEAIGASPTAFLPKAPLSQMRATLASGTTTPTRYLVWAEEVRFDTDKDETLSLDTNFYVSWIPADIGAGDNVPIPDQWVQALVKYIVFQVRLADRDAGLANGAYAEFEALRVQAAMQYKAQTERITQGR